MGEVEAEIEIEAILQRYSEAWKARDPDAIASLNTEDTRFCTHGAGETREGRAGIRAGAAETFELLPEFASEQGRVLFGPNHWVLEWTMINGETKVDCVDVITLEQGLVKTKDTYFDFAQLQAAMAALASG
jgi:hypothetical protein